MCGIFAYLLLNRNHHNPPHNIKLSSQLISRRGPDVNSSKIFENISEAPYYHLLLDFYRLSIMDPSEIGNQPMKHPTDDIYIICNGEIYNYDYLRKENNFDTQSDCDCEVILHMYKKYGISETVKQLDGVFSFVIYDKDKIYIARDPIGVRPLFYGVDLDNQSMGFCSEMKSLHNLFTDISIFPPGHYMEINLNNQTLDQFQLYKINYNSPVPYYKYEYPIVNDKLDEETAISEIKTLFLDAVNKRLMSDRPLGCLLSGGLDSSLVASIVSRNYKSNPQDLHTFSIGLEGSPDLKNAEIVADYLKTTHHRVELKVEDFINAVPEVIRATETYDITTIRASVPNYLLSKYISEKTDIVVIMSGEGADEILGGYLYFHLAPTPEEFQEETHRRVRLLHQFDVLRCDRSTAFHGLEVRVPFLDKSFIQYILSMRPELKQPDKSKNRIEKYILRQAFDGYLPDEILWRQKDAFSDAVGYNWVTRIKEYATTNIDLRRYENRNKIYPHNTPDTHEAFYYREVYDSMYHGNEELISEIWRPRWTNITDPSATALSVHETNKYKES